MPFANREQKLAYHKAYSKAHYENNKQYYFERNKRAKVRLREFVNELKNKPCIDCGNSFPPYAMDYDHRGEDNKLMEVADAVNFNYGKKFVLREIAKCDLVCANCHRIRTHIRMRDSLAGRTGAFGASKPGPNPGPSETQL